MKTSFISTILLSVAFIFIIGLNMSCNSSANSNKKTTDDITITGNYSSVKGVMKPLSCFCYNCGYLTTDDENEYNISFDEYDKEHGETNIECQQIKVTGYLKTITRENNGKGPCPGGEKEILIVTKYECIN